MRLRLADVATRAIVLFPPDPGRLRLLAALRATLAGLLTFLLVVLLGSVLPVPVPDRILGFAIGLFTGASVHDPIRRQQATTMLLIAAFALMTTAAAAMLLDHPTLTALLVPLIMAGATYGGTRAQRWGVVGTIALIAYIISLVTHQTPVSLPAALVVVGLGVADAALVRFVLLPEHPRTELIRLRRSICRGIAGLLLKVADAVRRGGWHGDAQRMLNRELDRLGEAMMMAEARVAVLAVHQPAKLERGLYLLEVQLATERVIRAAQHDLGEAERERLVSALTTTANALAEDRSPPADLSSAIGSTALGHTVAGLAAVLRESEHPEPGHVTTLLRSPPPVSNPGLGLRSAVQVAIAAGLAIGCGELVSPTRWYWAALAALVAFQGTRSRGESIAKVAQFMSGTLAGVFVGVLLATALSNHTLLTLAIIMIAVFFAFQAYMAAYAVMIFWITIILGLMFGMLGYFAPELLLLRLEETAAGAACGILVACFVLPRPTGVAIDAAVAELLSALGSVVDAAVPGLLDGQPTADLPAALLAIEQRLRELHAAVSPALAGVAALRNAALQSRQMTLQACEAWARELGALVLHMTRLDDPRLVRATTVAARRIDATISVLLGRASAQSSGDDPGLSVPTAMLHDPANRAVRLLLRIDSALLSMMARSA